MCGIFVVIPKSNKKLDIDKCKKALKDLDKRGPDWSLYEVTNNIFLVDIIMIDVVKKTILQKIIKFFTFII